MINYSILPKKVMDPIQLSLSLAGIAVRSQRLMVDFLTRRPELGGLGDPAGIGQAFLDLTAKMIADPMSIAQMQLELWKEHVKLLQRTTERLFGLTGKSDHRPVATDQRFQHPAWTENVLFDYIKQSYLLSAEAILSAVNRVDGLNPLLRLVSDAQHATSGAGRDWPRYRPHSLHLGLHQPDRASQSALEVANANGVDHDAGEEDRVRGRSFSATVGRAKARNAGFEGRTTLRAFAHATEVGSAAPDNSAR